MRLYTQYPQGDWPNVMTNWSLRVTSWHAQFTSDICAYLKKIFFLMLYLYISRLRNQHAEMLFLCKIILKYSNCRVKSIFDWLHQCHLPLKTRTKTRNFFITPMINRQNHKNIDIYVLCCYLAFITCDLWRKIKFYCIKTSHFMLISCLLQT